MILVSSVILFTILAAAFQARRTLPPAFEAPAGDVEPFGAGSDWDRQWVMLRLGVGAWSAGVRPEWDPFTGAGSPLAVNPESFVTHPAVRLAANAGPVAAFQALIGWSLAMGWFGAALLGWRLARNPWIGILLMTCVLWIPEFRLRLMAGHLMALGLCSWPLVWALLLPRAADGGGVDPRGGDPQDAALTLGIPRSGAPGPSPARWFDQPAPAVAGVVLGLSALGGAHYPSIFGLVLGALVLWTSAARPAAPWLLVAVFSVTLLPVGSPAWRPFVAAAALGTIAGGLGGFPKVLAFALGAARLLGGFLAVAGGKALGAWLVLQWSPRAGRRDEAAYRVDVPPLADLLDGGPPTLDGALALPPWAWALAIGGVITSVFARRPSMAAILALGALGLAVGRPSDPWFHLSRVPGFALLDYPGRLQWAFLLPPFGLLALPRLSLGAWPGRAGAFVAVGLSVALAARLRLDDRDVLGTAFEDPASPSVRGVDEDSTTKAARAVGEGLLLPGASSSVALERPEGTGPFAYFPSGSSIPPERGESVLSWSGVALPPLQPGERFSVQQRAFPGWRCEGAALDATEWTGGHHHRPVPAWLTGTAEGGAVNCRWFPPTAPYAAPLQLVAALFAVLAAVAVNRRRVGAP